MSDMSNGLAPNELLVSVIISTYNRCDALGQTLRALGRQTVPPDRYEVIVVDDGSSDDTFEVASGITLPCELRVFRHEQNRGVSAGRNLAMSHARGKYLILVSDDLIVPENFIATHLDTLERYPGFWVVGGLEQLPSLRETPFGRYLDDWERRLDGLRKHKPLGPGVWEMSAPTARNLSLPREDYLKIGPFDEQFRTTCEDQDWAHRASEFGVRFLYNTHITCLHNDQAGDLLRQCRFQERGAHDTVLLCYKYPGHRRAAIVRVNGYLSLGDGPALTFKKLVKLVMATGPMTGLFERLIALAEALRVAEPALWRLYRALIGLYIFRGWRRGLRTLREREGGEALMSLTSQQNDSAHLAIKPSVQQRANCVSANKVDTKSAKLSSYRVCLALAAICFTAFVILAIIPDRAWSELVISLFSRDRSISPTGYALISDILSRMRLLTAAGVGLLLAVALILMFAEREMLRVNRKHHHRESTVEAKENVGKKFLLMMIILCALRIVIGMAHLGDSLWHDELFTLKHYGSGSLSNIFGLSGENSVNNHVLNSLLVRLSVAMNWRSEAGLRIWNFLASVMTIPAAYYLGRVLSLGRPSLCMLLTIVSSSPVVDYYGSQVRGYGLAILLTTLSLALHLDCLARSNPRKLVALMIVNILLVLANLFTVPLVCGEVMHLVVEALYPGSVTRLRGYLAYSRHLLYLLVSLIVALALHICLLPPFIRDSIIFAHQSSVFPEKLLEFVSATLTPFGSAWIGGALLLTLVVYGITRKLSEVEKCASTALYLIILSGLGAALLGRIFELRAIAYLHIPVVALLALGAERLLQFGRFALLFVAALVSSICVWGGIATVKRPPIQDYRGLIREARAISNGRLMWTSGFAAGSAEYYAKLPILEKPPYEPSLYLSFFDINVRDQTLNTVKQQCVSIKHLPSVFPIAIYECAQIAHPKRE